MFELQPTSTSFQPVCSTAQHSNSGLPYYPIAIVGGGPAGTGPLLAALQQGRLSSLLQQGVAIFEGSDKLIRGSLGNYQVNSDTLSNAFLEIFKNDPESLLSGLQSEPLQLRSNNSTELPCRCQSLADFLKPWANI